jgi:hypothetical protein
MARICKACRQPVGRNPQDHDCPEEPDLEPEDSSDDGDAA